MELNELARQRVAKLERIRAAGVDPYPPRSHRTHMAAAALAAFQAAEQDGTALSSPPQVTVAGRLVALRPMGKATFGHLADGSGRIQFYVRKDTVGAQRYEFLENIDLADFLEMSGFLFRTRTGEVTVHVTDYVLLSKALLPMPEKWHGLRETETRLRQRYLDLMSSEETRRIFILRSRLVSAMRHFLDSRGFIEVETPVLQPLYGGAAARPFVTYYNALDRSFYLRIATELYLKRLIVGGLEKVYEIGKDFRNEGIDTRHTPEFTMMESYEAYADYHGVMRMVEEMITFLGQEVLGTLRLVFGEHAVDLTPPWRTMTVREAILQESGVDIDEHTDQASLLRRVREMGLEAESDMAWGKLVDVLLSAFVEPKLIQPTFLLDYPWELSPLAKRKPGDPRYVERFEAYIAGLEIANAFSELNDPLDQLERFQQQAAQRAAGDEEAHPLDEDYITALMHGMPPTGGLGVGIDRLVMLFTNTPSIREVILFPQLRTKT